MMGMTNSPPSTVGATGDKKV